jgi:hypothetical protein
VATRFFSDEQMERLRSFPDIGKEELIRFFTLTLADLAFIDNLGRGVRGSEAPGHGRPALFVAVAGIRAGRHLVGAAGGAVPAG